MSPPTIRFTRVTLNARGYYDHNSRFVESSCFGLDFGIVRLPQSDTSLSVNYFLVNQTQVQVLERRYIRLTVNQVSPFSCLFHVDMFIFLNLRFECSYPTDTTEYEH